MKVDIPKLGGYFAEALMRIMAEFSLLLSAFLIGVLMITSESYPTDINQLGDLIFILIVFAVALRMLIKYAKENDLF